MTNGCKFPSRTRKALLSRTRRRATAVEIVVRSKKAIAAERAHATDPKSHHGEIFLGAKILHQGFRFTA
jgi:hypothetical protein